ncbi:MAG TPA: hypothetical protein EYH22_02755 [Candidatus Nanopusillus sp.]|nr:hypothetical protein [Candidatus Nanopusillus sp.]
MEKVVVYKENNYFWTSKNNYNILYKLGKVVGRRVIYSPEEVLYLIEKEKIIVKDGDKVIDSKMEFLYTYKNNINIKKFLVLRRLRDVGYYVDIVPEGVLVHMKGERWNPIYLAVPYHEYEIIDWENILKHLESAKRYKSKLLLALIDIELDIVFYEVLELRF